MGRIVVSQNVSLDGVVEDPTGEEGFARGGWFNEMSDTDREAWAGVELEETLGADALLLGRRTDEFFGARWPGRSGDWADRLNGLPKYVISSTIEAPVWTNATVLSGDVVDEVARLKNEVDGEIVVYGSRRLTHALLEHGLVDELRLIVFPVVVGSGERLFPTTAETTRLRLIDAKTVGDGLNLLAYEVARAA